MLSPLFAFVLSHVGAPSITLEAAAVLNISVKTVETHRTNIMRKLRFHSIGELVRYAVKNHIVSA